MNDITTYLTLDLNCNKETPTINSAQFDKGRKLTVSITANGDPYSVLGCEATFKCIHSNKTFSSLDCTDGISETGTTVTITFRDDTFPVRGITAAKLVFTDGSRNYSTQIFLIDVDSSLDGNIRAKEEYSVLNKLIDDVRDVIDNANNTMISGYESLTPDVEFEATNDYVKSYLNSDAYTFTFDNEYNGADYASTNVPATIDSTVNERPNGGDIAIPEGGVKLTLYDTVAKTKWSVNVSGDTYTVKNLIPNRLYTYIIKNSSGEIIKSGSCKASGQVRFIDAGQATTYPVSDPTQVYQRPLFNIRDLGGWACDGGHIKYGLVYRGCRLNGNYTNDQPERFGISLTPAQIDFFKNFLGIRDEIDFRQIKDDPDTGNTETAGDDAVYDTSDDIKDTALGIGVDYTIIPLNPYIKGLEIKSSNADMNRRYANVIKRIARDISDKKPCYIHCLEGADRTGTVTMLILAICGVSRSDIERDYELTSFSKDYAGNRNRRARNDSAQSYRWMTLIQYLLGSSFTGATFRDKMIDYVLKIGVTIEEINTIRAGLIDGAPEKIKNPNSDVSVTYSLTNINTDNPISSIAMYQPFEAKLSALNMKEIQSVTVLMGNTDITSTAYIQEKISIPRVTGNISITASASDVDIYSKPSGGIPKTDLTSSVQTSLEKADSALQSHQDISGKADKATTLAGYGITDGQTKIDSSHKLSSDLVDDTDQTNKFVTDTDKTNWNNKLSSANGAVKSSNIDNGAVTTEKLGSDVNTILDGKVIKPSTSPNGTNGQILRTKGDGTTEWVDVGLPTDAQTAAAVSEWLDDHPEATTTVEDGSVTLAKLHSGVIDSTLSTQGAAAEAAVTGKRLKALEELNEPYNLYDRGTVYQIVDSNGNAASGLTIQSDGSLLCKVTYGAGNVRRLLDSARQLSPGTYTLSGKITLNENVTDTTATRSARCQIGSAVAAQTVPLTTERGGSESVPKTGNSGWFKFTATLNEAETFKFSVAPSSNLYCNYSLPAVISDLQLVKGSEIGDYSPNSHTNVDIKLRQEVEKRFENIEAEINAKAEKSRVDAHIEGLNLTINAAKSSDNQYYGSLYFEGDYYKGMPITVNHVRTDESNYTMQMFFYRAEPYDNDTKINIGSGDANQVAPNTSKTFVLPEKAVMMRIYYNAFPMTATITAPPVSHYLGDRIDDIAGDVADAVEAVGAFDVHVSGLNLSIDRAKADNNSTDGSIAFEGDFYKGMELNVSGYTQPEGVASTLQFYFKVHKTDSTFIKPPVWRISPNTDGVITVPENCEVMSIYCAHFPVTGVTITAPPLGKYLNDTVSELTGSSTDIVTLNKNALARLDEAKTFVKRRGRTDTYTPTFALLHFSDIHGATTALTRLVELKNHLGSKLNDTICTGDMVNDKYEDTMSFWDGVTGAGSILTCIGNHDVHHQGESSYTADQIGQTDTYTRYFAPYKDGWGVTIGENLTYYYKDYPTNKVRLIALNYLLTGDEATAQNTWLQARLAEAKTNGYTVIIAIHCQLQNSNAVDCSFTTFGKTTFGGQLDESYQASVQSFINDGGLFACYISGHTHWDAVAYNSNYPNQLCITVTIAGVNMNDNDQPRISGTITQDAANIVVLDTDIQTLKIIRVGANVDTYLRERNVLTYNYGSHSVVADY